MSLAPPGAVGSLPVCLNLAPVKLAPGPVWVNLVRANDSGAGKVQTIKLFVVSYIFLRCLCILQVYIDLRYTLYPSPSQGGAAISTWAPPPFFTHPS